MDNHKAYVYAPSSDSPAKRRKIRPDGLQSSRHLREEAFQQLWGIQRSIIDEVVQGANSDTLNEVLGFLEESSGSKIGTSLPCGFILGDLDSTVHASFFKQLADTLANQRRTIYVQLKASECPNLKTLLKSLIHKATSTNDSGEDELTDGIAPKVGRKVRDRKMLDYDLQILHDWIRKTRANQVVVVFQDGEAFEGHVIDEAIELLSLSLPKIPFALLFGIATSIENFQGKLPRAALRRIKSQQFDIAQSDVVLESVFCQTTAAPITVVRFGPMLSRFVLDRANEQIVGMEDFADALQYAYMTHFFANPLTVFVYQGLEFEEVSREHFEALRNLPSFRQLVEYQVKEGQDLNLIESWLDSNQALFDLVQEGLKPTAWAISGVATAVDLLAICRRIVGRFAQVPRSQLYIKAMQNELRDSSLMREALLTLKRAPSDQLAELLTTISPRLKAERQEVEEFSRRLQNLTDSSKAGEPFRSEHDVSNETMRTTVVAQRVELSRHKGNLSKNDSAYSRILIDFHNWLEDVLETSLIDVNTLFLRELFIFDQRVPHRAAFAPKTRHAIERALSSPHDYLACDCCALDPKDPTADAAIKATHPATCLLYQLYLESGPLINASDLWNAFLAVVADDETDEKEHMALFERALSELQYLGFVKGTRKKTDHIAKVAWKGL